MEVRSPLRKAGPFVRRSRSRCVQEPHPLLVLIHWRYGTFRNQPRTRRGAATARFPRSASATAKVLLLTRADVLTDLGMTPEQSKKAQKTATAFWLKADELKGKPDQKLVKARLDLTLQMNRWIETELSPQQIARLDQVDLWWEGPSALVSRADCSNDAEADQGATRSPSGRNSSARNRARQRVQRRAFAGSTRPGNPYARAAYHLEAASRTRVCPAACGTAKFQRETIAVSRIAFDRDRGQCPPYANHCQQTCRVRTDHQPNLPNAQAEGAPRVVSRVNSAFDRSASKSGSVSIFL